MSHSFTIQQKLGEKHNFQHHLNLCIQKKTYFETLDEIRIYPSTTMILF